jgi:hypothetical protein
MRLFLNSVLLPPILLLLAACASVAPGPRATAPDAFFAGLQTLCGGRFTGRLLAGDPVLDADFAQGPLVIGPVRCSADEVSIPFAVADDSSRTWVITRTDTGLRLKHRHRHNGHEETLSNYGGDTTSRGRATRQEFPADAFSRELFLANERPASVANVWAVEIVPGRHFTYELRRPGRLVRLRFAVDQPAPG